MKNVEGKIITEGRADKKVVWSKQVAKGIAQNRAGSHRFCWQVGMRMGVCELGTE